ncbi:hypothetical protein NN561_004355 [Cricetulus griseus]
MTNVTYSFRSRPAGGGTEAAGPHHACVPPAPRLPRSSFGLLLRAFSIPEQLVPGERSSFSQSRGITTPRSGTPSTPANELAVRSTS